MDRKIAEKIVREFAMKKGPQITVSEAMRMTAVDTDGYKMYALQKGDVTFLAWIILGDDVTCKTICW